MNEVLLIIVMVWVSFLAGIVVLLAIGKGVFVPYIQAFMSGRVMLRVHLSKGGCVFKLGMPVPGAPMVAFSMNGKKDLRFVSLNQDAVLKVARVKMMDIDENDSSPYVYRKVIPVTQEVEQPKVNDKGEVTWEGKNVVMEKVTKVAYRVFESWNDNAVIRQLYNWALMRPRRKLPGLGIDLKSVLIILAVVAGAIILIGQIKSGGAPSNIIG